IDLRRPCKVSAIRVKWWGDYGSRNTLQVFSSIEARAEDSSGDLEFTPRGRRISDVGLNGWTELAGWDEPSRSVKLELGNPCPDCFGLNK
ncbi:unnamed protein product, partial [Polarella glacialis]